jgi:hypothetical protein
VKQPHLPAALILPALLLLPGCLVTQSGNLEVLNPKQAYGRSLAVVGDLHRENGAIEQRLASDLRTALTKRGLTVAEDPAKADLVVVPTLGRMRERTPAPVAPVVDAASESVEAAEPVVAAPAPEARAFNRFSSANVITRSDLISRRAVPSARAPVGSQQAGLLLTAYRAEDYQDYGVGRQSLPPVWRIYVSQPATQMKWNSVAVPLISAAASAAKPLAKSEEHGAGSVEKKEEEKKDEKTKRPRAERSEPQMALRQTARVPPTRGEGKPKDGRQDNGTAGPQDEEPKKARKFFGLFGGSSERTE